MQIEIKQLSIEDPEFVYRKVEKLFAEMYEFMEGKDLILVLAENGETIWLNSIKSSLGKLNMVFIAFDGEEIIGFIAGSIKLGPAFLKSKKIGYVSHTYVVPGYRKSKVGHLLLAALEEWFFKNKVDHIEGEVLYHNEPALKFFKKLGYSIDNIRIYKSNKKS